MDPAKLQSDLKTLVTFIQTYCDCRHPDRPRQPVELPAGRVVAIAGHAPELCEDCRKLLLHAFVKRTHCPMDPKPQCKHCPNHCYAPRYRAQIREVMRVAGQKLLMRGRIHYLLHLLF